MKTKLITIATLLMLLACNQKQSFVKPPLAEEKPVTEKYFGKEVTDPYRYMEDTKDVTALNWIQNQSQYARNVLNSISGRKELIDLMKELDKRKTSNVYSLKITDNDYYFYLKRTPDDETGKLYYRMGFNGTEKLLFDPEKFNSDTALKYTISDIYPSLNGSVIALEIAPNGSENAVLYFIDVASGNMLSDKIDRVWFSSVSWLPDGKSFLYNRLQVADLHHIDREKDSKVFLHIIGNDPALDKEFFSRTKNPELNILPEEIPLLFYDKDSKYLYALALTVSNNLKVFYSPQKDMNQERIKWKTVFKESDQVYSFFASTTDIYALTPKNAPNFKIIRMPLDNPDIQKAETFIPENKEEVITEFTYNKNGLYYTTSRNGVAAKLYKKLNNSKAIEEITIPIAAGSISLLAKGAEFGDLWVTSQGWTSQSVRYRYDEQSNKLTDENLATLAKYPEYENLVAEELEISGLDGEKVPLSLIYNKTLKKDSRNPILIFGYGSYGYPISPGLFTRLLTFTSQGGILAIAHVRGGGEKGEKWHKMGQKTEKHHTWEDLISTAEYLIAEKYTSKGKIAIYGGSAGGILIGRAMTERPDLFAAAIPAVGCLNTLRMEMSPNGPVNAPEFGTMKDSVECMALIEMDAYLHLKNGTNYPATLVTAGMNDPRVIYWQPAKFAARLLATNSSNKPILFYTDYEAGHGIGNTKTKEIESMADIIAFALWQTGHPDFQLTQNLFAGK